jgi:hypothetical protein
VSTMRYELGFYIPEDGIPRGHRHENLKLYLVEIICSHLTGRGVAWISNARVFGSSSCFSTPLQAMLLKEHDMLIPSKR